VASDIAFLTWVTMVSMKARWALTIGGLVLGGAAVAAELEAGKTDSRARQQVVVPVAPVEVRVEMTSVNLGDDCGETPVTPARGDDEQGKRAPRSDDDRDAYYDSEVCNQTAMQLSVVAGSKALTSTVRVKKVELFDDKGTRIGELTARGPSFWSASAGAYAPWTERVEPGQTLAVRYVLSAPAWSTTKNRFNKMYSVKVLVTVGGSDKALSRDVYLTAESRLPPDVDT